MKGRCFRAIRLLYFPLLQAIIFVSFVVFFKTVEQPPATGAPMTKIRNNILVVDDSADMVEALSLLLEENGYIVKSAYNGQQALDLIDEEKYEPDLIILDMNMPKMGGIAFYHKIANLHDGTSRFPVLILTGRDSLEDLFRDFKVDGFMTKPFQFDDLVKEINRIFAIRYGNPKALNPAAAPAAPKVKPRRVLMVEEDKEHFDAIVHRFINEGVEVFSALDAGNEVISETTERNADFHLKKNSPDLILVHIESLNPLAAEFQLAAKLLQKAAPFGTGLMLYSFGALDMNSAMVQEMQERSGIRRVISSATPESLLMAVLEAIPRPGLTDLGEKHSA